MRANIFVQIKSVKYGGNILLIYLKMEQNEIYLLSFMEKSLACYSTFSYSSQRESVGSFRISIIHQIREFSSPENSDPDFLILLTPTAMAKHYHVLIVPLFSGSQLAITGKHVLDIAFKFLWAIDVTRFIPKMSSYQK